MLIVLSGLPGVGKTTIALELTRSLPAVYVRIDSIEQALRNGGADRQPLIIDTARRSVSESMQAVVSALPQRA